MNDNRMSVKLKRHMSICNLEFGATLISDSSIFRKKNILHDIIVVLLRDGIDACSSIKLISRTI